MPVFASPLAAAAEMYYNLRRVKLAGGKLEDIDRSRLIWISLRLQAFPNNPTYVLSKAILDPLSAYSDGLVRQTTPGWIGYERWPCNQYGPRYFEGYHASRWQQEPQKTTSRQSVGQLKSSVGGYLWRELCKSLRRAVRYSKHAISYNA